MQLSYAQRAEDLYLDRVFAGLGEGVYVDIGAGHPVADNATFYFYLKGWRGLVVEPQQALAELYARVRPRDIAVRSLVGKSEGETDFHIVDRLHGFSTMIETHARSALNFGASYVTQRMPVVTLKSLVRQHGLDKVDFLKIDVEGAEGDVLAGADFSTWRPRVILAEAMVPGTMAEGWHEWEPALLAHGYQYAFFDTLNRYYVANEASELLGRFPDEVPPWGSSAQHFRDYGRAHETTDHPDHLLTRALVNGFLATLPLLDAQHLVDLMLKDRGNGKQGFDPAALLYGTEALAAEGDEAGAEPGARDDLRGRLLALMDSDRFRAALGRIASGYDGGHIIG